MKAQDGLIILLPDALSPQGAAAWWHVQDGHIRARGYCNPAEPSGPAVANAASIWPVISADDQIMALLPPAGCVVRWTDMGALAPRQAEAAASLQLAGNSLAGSAGLHSAAVYQEDGDVLTACLAKADMARAIAYLNEMGLDPDIVLPAGLIFGDPETGVIRAELLSEILGGGALLRGRKLICPDEPALRAALIGEQPVTDIGTDGIDSALEHSFAAPRLNLRSGVFAKRRAGRGIDSHQWRILAWLVAAGLAVSLLLALATYWQYSRASAREDTRTVAAARAFMPSIAPDIAAADVPIELDRQLAQQGRGARLFAAPASTLFTALQREPSVMLRDVRYDGGLMSFTIAAPTAEPINRILIKLQAQGHRITAVPRQDSTGLTLADISMRTP